MGTMTNGQTGTASVILVGIDFSQPSMRALRTAENMARAATYAELHLVHAFGSPIVPSSGREVAVLSGMGFIENPEKSQAELDNLVSSISHGISRVTGHLRLGSPASVIVRLAAEISADLIVVGTHGRTGVSRLVFGSVAEKVVRTSPCAVLTVRPKSIPAWEQIEPPCPDCVRMQRSTSGDKMWCERHSRPHVRPHTYRDGASGYGLGAQSFRNM